MASSRLDKTHRNAIKTARKQTKIIKDRETGRILVATKRGVVR